MSGFKVNSTIKAFGGYVHKLSHKSEALGGLEANLNVFIPAKERKKDQALWPVLYYLGGLTCTGDNGLEKGNILGAAAESAIACVFPDTSPRGAGIDGEKDSWDFGTGAGFYVDATTPGYKEHYRMETYITSELPKLLNKEFSLDASKTSIFGHSMGGHGALTLYLKYPDLYQSVSAFAPICNPTQCDWGKKAFKGYFGEGSKADWAKHDATELLKSFDGEVHGLVDSGTGDQFYKQKQLLPEHLQKVAQEKGQKGLEVRLQDEYDHSYPSIIASFAPEHVKFHAKFLRA